jgi:hypothetical protein
MIVIRGYILPKRGPDDSPVYVESIDEESAKKMFEEFTDLVKGVLDIFTNNGKNRITNAKKLSVFLDSLVAYFKSLAFIGPIPMETDVTKIMPASLQSLFIYLSHRELLRGSAIIPYKKDGLENLEELSKYAGETAKLYSEEKIEKFYDVLRFPADTRPGCNTSSLLIHSLTTSALASAYYIDKNGVDEKLHIVRLAAIFHDIGKFLDWRRHEELSGNKMEELFDRYVDGEARGSILEASKLIRDDKHVLRSFLNSGDAKSSELDRLSSLFCKVIKNTSLYGDLEKCLKDYAKGVTITLDQAFRDWIFWRDYVKEDLARKLTEEFCKRVSMIDKENVIFADKSEDKVDKTLFFIRIDVRKIQQFIKVNDIWAMNGASRLIDLVLYVCVPAYLVDELNMPLESVLYFGGGNETLILPKNLIGEGGGEIDSLIAYINDEFFKGSSTRLVFGTSPFYSNFRSINSAIDRELVAKKIGYDGPQVIDPNIYAKCEFCSRTPASILSDKGKVICDSCKEKLQLGEAWHFRVRSEFLGLNWNELRNYVIEYIAGHSPRGPEPGEEYLALSMIKFDGILIGQIMSSSISLTDACERSFRIDLSVKNAIRGFMRKLLDLNEKDDFNRMVLGLMYVGGDDGVVLLPSRLSLPFALYLMNEYYLNMGCKNALSLGIIAAKPKHPLVHLYEACDSLLNVAKEARNDCYEKLHRIAVTVPSESFRGSLAFFMTDGGWATSETIASIVNEAWNGGISRMKESYFLSNAQDKKSILRLMNIVEYDMKIDLNDLSAGRLLEIVKEGKDANTKEEKVYRLRELRNYIHDIFASSKLKVKPGKMEFIYTVKEAESAPSNLKRILMKEIAYQAFQKMNSDVNLNLYDLFLLVKLLGGGRL